MNHHNHARLSRAGTSSLLAAILAVCCNTFRTYTKKMVLLSYLFLRNEMKRNFSKGGWKSENSQNPLICFYQPSYLFTLAIYESQSALLGYRAISNLSPVF